MQVVEAEMLVIKKKYRDDRRSQIVENASDIVISKSTDAVPVENFVVGLNSKGKIRKIKPATFKRIESDGEPNARDVFKFTVDARSDQFVYAFTNLGNCYKIDMELLSESKGTLVDGVSFETLFPEAEKGEMPVSFFAVKGIEVPDGKLMFYTKQGMVKLTDWKEYTVQKGIYQAIKLKDGDELIWVEQEKENTTMFFVTEKGMCLNAEKDKLPEQGRVAGGVKGVDLYEGDKVVFSKQVNDETDKIALGATTGEYKVVAISSISRLARARKGVKIFELGDSKLNEKVLFADSITGDETKGVYIVDRMGVEYYSDTDQIVREARTTKGKPIKNIGTILPEFTYLFARHSKD